MGALRSTLEARLASLRHQRFVLRSEIEVMGPATPERAPLLARKKRRLRALNRQIALTEVDLMALQPGTGSGAEGR
ncbi:MAG TPA: hypothetical protein VJX92_00060 [Methylomirabilota bacterium]|nr:hypothetical protein [Methylomirabilota bacterium]